MDDNITQALHILCIVTCVAHVTVGRPACSLVQGTELVYSMQHVFHCFGFFLLFLFFFFSFFSALAHCFWLADPMRRIEKKRRQKNGVPFLLFLLLYTPLQANTESELHQNTAESFDVSHYRISRHMGKLSAGGARKPRLKQTEDDTYKAIFTFSQHVSTEKL